MLVILSDLHLNDGTTGATLSPGAFSLFGERLKEMALTASWRADGSYRPIERIDLVLLGDVLDLLRSARWNARPEERPWGDPQLPGFADQITRITTDILSQNQESFATLRALSEEGGVAIPPMLRAARMAKDAEMQPVSVRIHYMVGNHDWFYHLQGDHYDSLRRKLIEQMGLANPPNQPFPHDITESDELLQTMRRHKVTARHGDIFDPLSYEGDRDASSMNDAIVLELVNPFLLEVEQALGHDLPDSLVLGLREIDYLRPLLLIPAWIEGLLERNCPQPALRKRIKSVWDGLVDNLISSDFVRERDAASSLGLVDGLDHALRFSKRRSTGWTASTNRWLQEIRGAASASYAVHALAERDFRNRRAKHVVFGHTHAAEMAPLDSSHAEGYVLDQVYFNTGTWRPVFGQTRFAPGEQEFIASDAMTYLAFFQGDERKGRSYESWTGSLGHCLTERIIYRIDAGSMRRAASQGMSSLGRTPPPPHFGHVPATSAKVPSRRRP